MKFNLTNSGYLCSKTMQEIEQMITVNDMSVVIFMRENSCKRRWQKKDCFSAAMLYFLNYVSIYRPL